VSLDDLLSLLAAPDRAGAPEPSLLGWLARHASAEDWHLIRAAADHFGSMVPPFAWPVIGETVDGIAAGHTLPDVGYPAGSTRVRAILDPVRRGAGRYDLDGLTDHEVAYCLPAIRADRAEAEERALAAFEDVVRGGHGWYAAVLAARIGPQLIALRDTASAVAAERRADALAAPWSAHVRALLRRSAPSASASDELDLSHPLVGRLDRIAAGLPAAQRHDACRRTLLMMRRTTPSDGVRYSPPPTRTSEPPDSAATSGGGRPATLGPGAVERTAPTAEPPARADERLWVGIGLAEHGERRPPLPADRSLRTDTSYLFWFQITDQVETASIEPVTTPFTPPPGAVPGTTLTVTLVGSDAGILVSAGQDAGELVFRSDGTIGVHRQPDGEPAAGQRLFFPIRTPGKPGRYRLRCNLYCHQTLLQSRSVEMRVDAAPTPEAAALVSRVDYVSGPALEPAALAALPEVDLSIMVDDHDGAVPGRCSLVTAGGAVTVDIALGAGELEGLVERTRAALRVASQGSEAARYTGPFRYDGGAPADFAKDLRSLAIRGQQVWAAIGGRIAIALGTQPLPTGDGPAPPGPAGLADHPLWRLGTMLRRPLVIEVANTADARILIPAALVYDRPLDRVADHRLCPAFLVALDTHHDLASSECFLGHCPTYGDTATVCPSGFWGFRHQLGVPQSASHTHAGGDGGARPANALTITHNGVPRCVVGMASEFPRAHPERVRSLGDGRLFADRESLLADLSRFDDQPHLVYFFCHGDYQDGMPTLRVGREGSPQIAAVDIETTAYWPTGRPLVFLNGCRTVAAEPRHAFSFINAFVRAAGASGMIGTEIVTYESLAADFADLVLDEFVTRGRTLAHAMRTARLALLARRNPLGLIYTAYAPPNLRMQAA
jgi:hypothetical protein